MPPKFDTASFDTASIDTALLDSASFDTASHDRVTTRTDRPSPQHDPGATPQRVATRRHLLMVPPAAFDVRVQVNPWMHPEEPIDRALACEQWRALHDRYVALGHTVEVVPPVDGLDDMVFAANAGVVMGGRALLSRMRHPHRVAETDAWEAWLASRGYDAVRSTHHFEGEGDVVRVGDVLVVAEGPRTDPRARGQLRAVFDGLEVVGVELVDPRWYHLDTAMFALDDTTLAWHPPALSEASRALVHERWPDAVEVGLADAEAFGANSVSDGRNVVLPAGATGLAGLLEARGFVTHLIDLSELLKSGGAAKCCTLEVHA